jgi:hypothetical protein
LYGGTGGMGRVYEQQGGFACNIDWVVGPHFDISKVEVRRSIVLLIREGVFSHGMVATPCTTFSTARDRTLVIRCKVWPWGRPDLPEKEQLKILQGNVTARFAVQVFRECRRVGTPCAVENPWSSRLWQTPEFKCLINKADTSFGRADFCQYGTAWRKATGFLACHVSKQAFSSFCKSCTGRKLCSRTSKCHHVLSGSSPSGKPWTLVAQPYPRKLCVALCALLRTHDAAHPPSPVNLDMGYGKG